MNSVARRLHRAISAAAAFVGVVAIPDQAHAWGASGHRMIGYVAIHSLPPDMPEFIRSEQAAWQVGELAREADRSRDSGAAHDRDRDPGHFIDLSDDQTVAGAFPLNTLPASREDYDTALRAKATDQYRIGFLPYQIIDGWQQLVKDFAYWRADRAGEKLAGNETERAWFAADRALREQLIVRDLGYWAHFVGDGSQPMHVSVHYDGWGDFPNPQNYSAQRGLHARFEGAYVHDNVTDADIAAAMMPWRPFTGSIQDRVTGYLLTTQKQLIPLFELENMHAFDAGNPGGKPFVVERLAAGAIELRDMIADAWTASANVEVGFPGISIPTLEQGYSDIFGPLYGED